MTMPLSATEDDAARLKRLRKLLGATNMEIYRNKAAVQKAGFKTATGLAGLEQEAERLRKEIAKLEKRAK